MGTASSAKKQPAKRKGAQRKTKVRSVPRAHKAVKTVARKQPAKKKVTQRKTKARSAPHARKVKKTVSKAKKPPAKRKVTKRKTKASSIPSEHKALETVIRGIQKSYKNQIPESRFAQHIQRVAGVVAQAITAADQLMVACQIPSIELVSRMVIMDKDQKSGRMGTEKDLNRVLMRLGATPLGKEGLYRVVHAISSSVIQDLLPISSSASLREIQSAAFMFAAQPLLQELMQEEGFRA
jgi:hypothetical protein